MPSFANSRLQPSIDQIEYWLTLQNQLEFTAAMSPLRQYLLPLLRRTYSTQLPNPTWSVRTLLPSSPSSTEGTPTISPSTLSHLLRLSALPPPADPTSLHNHLHFVRSLRSVPTKGVTPLAAIRDEIDISPLEYTYQDIVAAESLDLGGVGDAGRVQWEAVARAKRKVGEYFVVDEAVTDELVKPEKE